MRTYLVTGGAGFIGSNYIHYMFKKYDNEIRIINVDALTYAGNLENLKDIENRENYTFVKADICDKKAISKIFAENDIDRVVHFAAESHVDRSIRNPEIFVQTNVLGTAVMLNCAKAAWELPDGSFKAGKKFLHVSTDEVYGSLPDDDNAFFYETTPYDPHSPYSASKASSDMLVKAYMDTCQYHQLLQQLRSFPVPREADPSDHQQCPSRQEASGIRRRQKCPRLAVCRGSCEGHRHGTGAGKPVPDLQYRRTQREAEHRDHPYYHRDLTGDASRFRSPQGTYQQRSDHLRGRP